MRFWDASAIVLLCCRQPASASVEALLRADDDVVVWWATPVECLSALARLEREAVFTDAELAQARAVLDVLGAAWSEVLATSVVRERAAQLLRRHPLRAADALQLGAALTWADGLPRGAALVALDERLREAATGEGFDVLP